jgi:glycine/sarcosine N-methyltransferase
MGFYEAISKYYDYIFPVGKDQVSFIKKVAGHPPKALLDVACGTGGYSLELAKQGYEVTAIDLDSQMVETLRTKAVNSNMDINALQGDMLEISKKLNSKIDVVFCIGNSVVHLNGEAEIEVFFKQVKGVLEEQGSFIIQIVNYDRILKDDIRSLPTIINEQIGLKFERYYCYDEIANKVFFKTIMEVDGNKTENEIPLYPILIDQIVKLLNNAGFYQIKLFGDFQETEFDLHNSNALVIEAS